MDGFEVKDKESGNPVFAGSVRQTAEYLLTKRPDVAKGIIKDYFMTSWDYDDLLEWLSETSFLFTRQDVLEDALDNLAEAYGDAPMGDRWHMGIIRYIETDGEDEEAGE